MCLLMYNQLTSEQRYFIEVSLQNGMSKKMIAESLKVHQSTIYREISRNKGVHHYHHRLAQQKCDERKHRMRASRTFTVDMRKRIFTLLVDEQWSPEQIKGYLERHGESCVSVDHLLHSPAEKVSVSNLRLSSHRKVIHQPSSSLTNLQQDCTTRTLIFCSKRSTHS